MNKTYNPPIIRNGVRVASFGAILSTALQVGQQIGSMMPDTNTGNYLKGVFDPLANLSASISYASEGKIGKALLSHIPGIGTFLKGKDDAKREAERLANAKAIEQDNYVQSMKNTSISNLLGRTPNNMVSMYPTGGIIPGDTINQAPRPNAYRIIYRKVPKLDEVGNPTGKFITKADTIYLQDNGSWGENFQGVNIPDGFAIDANGKLIISKREPSNTIAKMANGGNVFSQGSPLSMGRSNEFVPASGYPMTQGATKITTPDGSTAGHHETGQNIPIFDNNGVIKAITEPGEVLVDDVIISKRNGLAQKYIALDKQKQLLVGKFEKAKTPEAKAGISRSISFYDKQLDAIKAEQEELAKQQPAQTVVPVAANGLDGLGDPSNLAGLNLGTEVNITGSSNYNWDQRIGANYVNMLSPMGLPTTTNPMLTKRGVDNTEVTDPTSFDVSGSLKTGLDVASMILPSAMNYKNSKIMDKSMAAIEAHRPLLTKLNNIKPDYQVGDQVAATNSNYATMNELAAKVSSPLTASSIMARAGVDRIVELNKIMGDKNRADAAMYNQQISLNNQVDANNTNTLNQFANFKLENRLSLNNAKINLNNTTADNLYTMLQDHNLREKDRITLSMVIKSLNQYGTITRKMSEELKAMGIDIANFIIK